jgi:hypothetical protein
MSQPFPPSSLERSQLVAHVARYLCSQTVSGSTPARLAIAAAEGIAETPCGPLLRTVLRAGVPEALRPPTGRRPSNAHTHRAVSQQFLRTPSRHSFLLCKPVVGDG